MKPVFIKLTKAGQGGGSLYINMEKVTCMLANNVGGVTELFFIGEENGIAVLESPKQVLDLVYTAYTPVYMDVGPG